MTDFFLPAAAAVLITVSAVAVLLSRRTKSVDTTSPIIPTRYGDDTANVDNRSPGANRKLFKTDETVRNLGSGDSYVVPDFLSAEEAREAFERLQEGREVTYQQWYHMPNKSKPNAPLDRLRRIKLACANPTPDGLIPLYRFPVNNQQKFGITVPMPAVVDELRQRVEKVTGHTYNHSVVLLYKDGDECIGFHKDKTLDLATDAPIVSISLGCERPYVLRDNIFRTTAEQEFVLPHGCLFALGPETNTHWYHSVRQLTAEERAMNTRQRLDFSTSIRISVTFRKVTSFMDAAGIVHGAGAAYQTLNWPVELNGSHRYDDEALESNSTEPEVQTTDAETIDTNSASPREEVKDSPIVTFVKSRLTSILQSDRDIASLIESGDRRAGIVRLKERMNSLLSTLGSIDDKELDKLIGRAVALHLQFVRSMPPQPASNGCVVM